jgi:hypothetical protein
MEGVALEGVFPELDKVASFGVLRGCDTAMKMADEYWHIDHGYFSSDGEKYYRITRNATIHSGRGDHDWGRVNKFNYDLKDWRKDGKFIVLCAPSVPMIEFLGIQSWVENTVAEIRKHSDRKIIITQKPNAPDGFYPTYKEVFVNLPISEALKNAWVLVTDHSNTMTTALMSGVPVVCTNKNRKIGSLGKIENPTYERGWLKNLAYNQWTLRQIRSGQAWEELNLWG